MMMKKTGYVLMVFPATGLFLVGRHMESLKRVHYNVGKMVIYQTRKEAEAAKCRKERPLKEKHPGLYRVHIQEVEYRIAQKLI
jgi:hypothetical protein